jgi:2-amino-4-hydroxy-6-hydroxymethyldihydropteridine diphosphokinase
MKIHRVFLGIGSNVGDRAKFLNRATAELKRVKDTKIVWTSSVYETDAYGKTDQPKFLNAIVEIETSLAPPELLDEIKAVEGRTGRTPMERWGPREIDVDILLYEGLVYSDDRVTVPHPELEKRKFVLVPFREIAPDVVHPVTGLTVEELAASCPDTGRVVKSTYRILI